MRQRGRGDRRQRVEIGLEVEQVLDAHALIGGVGEGRIEVDAARRDAELHGVDEIEVRPAADAVIRIGRDVGHVEGAEGGLQRLAATELQSFRRRWRPRPRDRIRSRPPRTSPRHWQDRARAPAGRRRQARAASSETRRRRNRRHPGPAPGARACGTSRHSLRNRGNWGLERTWQACRRQASRSDA